MHICCVPCTAYPLTVLREKGHNLAGFFYNPNIHPYREFANRLAALEKLANIMGLPVEYDRGYGLRDYLRQVVFHEEERCGLCYEMRLRPTALSAKEQGADAFTTTLLYSKYQDHALIRQTGESIAAEQGIPFYYQDFRVGWQAGVDLALAMDLYRQSYCGCIYSEQERYDKQLRGRRAVTY